MKQHQHRKFWFCMAIITSFSFSSARSQDSTEECTRDMKIFEKTFLVHLSPQIDSLWPGQDYFHFHRINIYDHIDSTWGEIDSVDIFLPGKCPHKMKDDGQHMDGCPEDSMYGYYELVDWETIQSYQPGQFFEYMVRIITETYGLDCNVDCVPTAESLPIPENLYPAHGDTIRDISPTFYWQSIPNADGYGIIVWDHMPMPASFQDGVVWDIFIADNTTTDISMASNSVQLVHGKKYHWAVWSWSREEIIDGMLRWNIPSMHFEYFVYFPDRTNIETPFPPTIPAEFSLSQNYPNPFNLHTTIRYSIPTGVNERTVLRIFNVLGQEICTLVDETKGTGIYTVQWDGKNGHGLSISSGYYFYELEIGGKRETKQMTVLK